MKAKKKRTQGMHWIRDAKRLAIYLRDGLACGYCGSGVERGIRLTLDHLIPYSIGGSNDQSNLITCCLGCNSARGTKKFASFVKENNSVVDAASIIAHIRRCTKRTIRLAESKELIARRGGFVAAVKNV